MAGASAVHLAVAGHGGPRCAIDDRFHVHSRVDQEQNPFIRHLAEGLGIVGGTSLGKLGQVLAVAAFVALTPRLARLVFTVVILLNLFAFVVNMRVFILSV